MTNVNINSRFLLLLLSLCSNGLAANERFYLADVKIVELPHTDIKVKPTNIELHEIEGYIDTKYVRLVAEIENNRYITGNIFDKSGKSDYVTGEIVDGVYHLYDSHGAHFTLQTNNNHRPEVK